MVRGRLCESKRVPEVQGLEARHLAQAARQARCARRADLVVAERRGFQVSRTGTQGPRT